MSEINQQLFKVGLDYPVLTVFLATVVILVVQYQIRINTKPDPTLPPMVPYWFPFFGSMVTYGMNPVLFLEKNRKIYGDNFTFLMFGRKITHCLGNDGNHLVLNAKHTSVKAEDAYRSLTKPVFGPNVVYDTDNATFMEQKRMVKVGLTNEYLRSYVSLIEKETLDHIANLPEEGELCIFKEMSRLIIKTASRCLLGKEVRSQLDESFADLYHDLDRGFTPVHFLFEWLPLPSFWRRDAAHLRLRNFFMNIIKNRRENNIKETDMLGALMEGYYKDGTPLPDEHTACMLIALTLAGQHTSSTTSTWALLYLAENPGLIESLRQEQKDHLDASKSTLDLDDLKKLDLLDNVVRETLRIKPPLLELMRKVALPVPIPNTNYVIPPGHYIAAAPVVSAVDEKNYPEPYKFDPYRWMKIEKTDDVLSQDKVSGPTVDYGFGSVSTSSARAAYLPFGAGRHRCIGDAFAYIQLKTIITVFVDKMKFKIPEGTPFPSPDFTNLVAIPELPAKIQYQKRKD